MTNDPKAPPAPSPVTRAYQEAMARLSAGELTPAVKGMLRIHKEHLDTEEALFVEGQLNRIRRLWPDEAQKAGLTDDAWIALQDRAAARRKNLVLPPGLWAVAGLLLAAAAWTLLVAVAPRTAFLGRVDDVALIFRLIAALIGLVSAATAFGVIRLKWEAVNAFIVLSPIFIITTFIGLTESGDALGKVLCAAALAAEIGAAWYMSKESHRFTR